MTRDENGRFVKGHPPMGGRPPRAKEEMYYRILMTRCSQKDWQAIVDKAIEQAKRGDAVARKWLTDYFVGTPEHKLDITSGGEQIFVTVKGLDD